MSVVFEAATPARRGRRPALVLVVLALVGLVGVAVLAVVTRPKAVTGDLYFTTFQHQSLYAVSYDYSGSRPTFGARRLVARLPNADGAAFEPDGKAIVAGQNSGTALSVDRVTGAVASVPSGCAGAFDVKLAPSGGTVYMTGEPGDLCAMPTDPLRAGHKVPLQGDDTEISSIAFDDAGRAFYTTGLVTGQGNFGTLDLATGSTTRELSGLPSAHGMAFDPFTKTLFLCGGTGIIQIDPRHPQQVVSSMQVPGTQFDNVTTDGDGHLYGASNFGQLVVVDYHLSGVLGDQRDVVTELHLKNTLDDVAPLVGPGAVLPGVRRWVVVGFVGFGLLLLLALLYRYGPSVHLTSQLPNWDIRRQELEARRRNARRITRRQERPPPRGPGW